MMVYAPSQPESLRNTLYVEAFATAVQDSETEEEPAVADSAGAARAGQEEVFWLDGSDAAPHAILCRSKAAKIAEPWGVPLFRFPSSSSAVRSLLNQEFDPQPSEFGREQL